MDELSFHHQSFLKKINQASTLKELEELRLEVLGKKGFLTEALKSLQALTLDAKKERALLLNQFKEDLLTAFTKRKRELETAELEAQLKSQTLDITLPARPLPLGTLHPISQTIAEIVTFFKQLG